MDIKPRTSIKVERKSFKRKINPFLVDENLSSRKQSMNNFTDNSNKKFKHYSDRKIIQINFNENQKRKSIKESIKKSKININENNIKPKSSSKKINLITISTINKNNIHKWKEILYNHNRTFQITQLNENTEYNDDELILNPTDNYDYNQDDIEVLEKDSVRTRVSETKLITDYVKNLELLIKFFIKENKVKYKQGLNEVIGAFLLLKYSNINEDFTFSEIYNLLNGFINLFIFNYYYDESIYSIKNSFSLLNLLIKYHAPEIYNLFHKANIFPEMYATSWILTVFAYKLTLNNLFYFWNKIILEDDQMIIHYLILALLIYRKNIFINYDRGSIPIIINKISIETQQDIDNVFKSAIDLRAKTPYSFRLFAYKLDILKHKSTQHKIKFELYHPDNMVCLPIFPSEIYYVCYNNIIKCPDEIHIKNIKIKSNCEHCDMKINKETNYILFDLRILEKEKYEKSGFLPQMIMVEQKELNEDNIIKLINNRFNDVKNKYHFVFMTSKVEECLNKNEQENDNNFSRKKGKNENKNEGKIKIIHLDKQISKKLTHHEKNNIKECYNLKKLLQYLIKNNYQYVSYIYGGFETIHNEILNNKKLNLYSEINLLNHNEEKCYLCKNNRKMFKALSPKTKKTSITKISFFKSLSPKKLFLSKLSKDKNQINIINIKNSNENKDELKIISIDEVNKMITNTKYFAGPCTFMNLENHNANEKKSDNQGLLIIDENKLYVIKTPLYNSKPMQILHEILITNLKGLEMKSKFIVHINFNKMNNENKSVGDILIVKFNYEQDSEKFINSVNNAKNNNS